MAQDSPALEKHRVVHGKGMPEGVFKKSSKEQKLMCQSYSNPNVFTHAFPSDWHIFSEGKGPEVRRH